MHIIYINHRIHWIYTRVFLMNLFLLGGLFYRSICNAFSLKKSLLLLLIAFTVSTMWLINTWPLGDVSFRRETKPSKSGHSTNRSLDWAQFPKHVWSNFMFNASFCLVSLLISVRVSLHFTSLFSYWTGRRDEENSTTNVKSLIKRLLSSGARLPAYYLFHLSAPGQRMPRQVWGSPELLHQQPHDRKVRRLSGPHQLPSIRFISDDSERGKKTDWDVSLLMPEMMLISGSSPTPFIRSSFFFSSRWRSVRSV